MKITLVPYAGLWKLSDCIRVIMESREEQSKLNESNETIQKSYEEKLQSANEQIEKLNEEIKNLNNDKNKKNLILTIIMI